MHSLIKLVVSRRPATKEKQEQMAGQKSSCSSTTFPPLGYQPTPLNTLLANALDLTAPASDALVKNRKNSWIQLAGHPGCFAPAGPTTIWKRQPCCDNVETRSYRTLMSDAASNVVPKFFREVQYNEDTFIELEDLLQHFTDPNIMDMKMGTRTFLESEVKNPTMRSDLYEKMIKLDASAPTQEEYEKRSITKLRYMQFREGESSTMTLGFRIEAIRLMGQTPNTDLKKVKTKEEVTNMISSCIGNNLYVCQGLLCRLKEIRSRFESSKFFKHHEIIGSSLLILYDQEQKMGVWMIDFAKTLQVSHGLSHRAPWKVGNHEDGYLIGLDNLIQIVTELSSSGHVTDKRSPSSTSDGVLLVSHKKKLV